MHGKTCPYEDAVSRAIRSREWPESLTVHVSQCVTCKELTEVAQWMTVLALKQGMRSNNLPGAETVWRLAQFEHSIPVTTRAKVEWFQLAAEMAAPAILAIWVAENWDTIQAASAQLMINTWPDMAGAGYFIASLVPMTLAMCAMVLAYPIFPAELE